MNDFADSIWKIDCVKENSYGNQILYDLCSKERKSWEDTAALADKIWLIGRAYAASPERRFSKKGDGEENVRGDGTGLYFRQVADYIMKKFDSNILAECSYFDSPYNFDGGEEDVRKLNCVVEMVVAFNEWVVEASKDFDKKHNPTLAEKAKYKEQQISFSSKFLHFHFPHSVFIKDRFSFDGGCLLCGNPRKRIAILCGREVSSAVKDKLKEYEISLETQKDEKKKEYAEHCIRSYMLCRFLKEDLKIESALTYPRLSDRVFQNIKIRKVQI